MTQGTMAITMAGHGSRFTKAGYDRPKYAIEVLGRPLFDWSMLGLDAFRRAGWSFAFAVSQAPDVKTYITDRSAALDIPVAEILTLDAVTDGQATTARLLAERAPAEAPFAVFNIDTFVAPGAMAPPAIDRGAPLDGWVPCFPAPGDGWSFAKCDAEGWVTELREKQRISDHATLGLYWFRSAAAYLAAYDAYYAVAGREEKGERYIAPLYNQIIADGGRVAITDLTMDDVGMLGTPDQLEAFAAAPPPAAAGLAHA